MFTSVFLEKYRFNRKNSSPGSRATRFDPGNPPEVAIDIDVLSVEGRTDVLKKLKVGQTLSFVIDQDLLLNDRGDINEYYARGEGEGEIVEINIDEGCLDDEYQEIQIVLNNGYAEGL
jgi:hypothetical protein